MIRSNSIKCVIWDLDDTFWKGTLSEGPIDVVENHIKLIKDLTDRGIVNTICSKNDYEPTVRMLQELGVDEYFVFKSIDWTPKGQRISQLIKDMGLRPTNCLFLDDNIVNLNEARFYSDDLMVAEPSEIPQLVEFCNITEASDLKHKRLNQYKVLEKKHKAKAEAGDNLQFLYASNTQVEIHDDCKPVADRLFELINRTNQLNFTKNRCSRAEFDAILDDKNAYCGYVTVRDNFGDYGIVGFFAIRNHRCVHFLFSCRTIGQGVEQWVYTNLGYPELIIVGEVVNKVYKIEAPKWINQAVAAKDSRKNSSREKIVFKGPCDLELLASFLSSDKIYTEFTYIGVSKHNSIEHHNHSINYLAFHQLSKEEQDKLLQECIFNDKDMFNTHMYDHDVALIFLSTLIEANLGVYKRNSDGFKIAFGEWAYPLTDSNNWDNYVKGEITNYGNMFTKEWLKEFSKKYSFIGRISPSEIVHNIEQTLLYINKDAHLCLILGSEIPFLKNTQETYRDREVFHSNLNGLLRELSNKNERIHILDFNKYIKSQEDFMNNINHFQRRIYYEASKEANLFIEKYAGIIVQEKGSLALMTSNIKAFIIEILKKQPRILNFIQRIVRHFKK